MIESILENSRLAESIKRVESGEAVDWKRVAELQALDIARAGELFAVEVIKSEKEADDRFEQLGKPDT